MQPLVRRQRCRTLLLAGGSRREPHRRKSPGAKVHHSARGRSPKACRLGIWLRTNGRGEWAGDTVAFQRAEHGDIQGGCGWKARRRSWGPTPKRGQNSGEPIGAGGVLPVGHVACDQLAMIKTQRCLAGIEVVHTAASISPAPAVDRFVSDVEPATVEDARQASGEPPPKSTSPVSGHGPSCWAAPSAAGDS
jgi:hypothetical protein